MKIVFDRTKLEAKKKLAMNILREKNCYQCAYYLGPQNSLSIHEYCNNKKVFKLPESRICSRWSTYVNV